MDVPPAEYAPQCSTRHPGHAILSSGIKSAREIVQCVWLEGKLTFNLVRHLITPYWRREHKTLGACDEYAD